MTISSWRTWDVERKFLAVMLLIVLAKGVMFTFVMAPFTGHDEVTHYAYLDVLAREHRLPHIPDLGEWQAEQEATGALDFHDHIPPELWKYRRYTTQDWWHDCEDAGCDPVYALEYPYPTGTIYWPSGWIYTGNHPPLYYLTMLPVYWAADDASPETKLYLLRLATIPFGLITVLFTWLTARMIFPRDWFVSSLATAFVAFQPQVNYEAAMLNNDIVAVALTSVILYLLARGLRFGFTLPLASIIGCMFGLAMLAKSTSVVVAAVVAVAIVLGFGIRNWKAWLAHGVVAGGVAALLVWPWYLYMWTTYGSLTALDRISELQSDWNYDGQDPPTVLQQLFDLEFARARWGETWGEFGWRLIPLDQSLLNWILVGCAVGPVGLIVWGLLSTPNRATAIGVGMLIFFCLISYYAVLQFGTTFSLTQARYYFPAVSAAGILLALGYRTLTPKRWRPVMLAGVFTVLAILNVVIFSEYLIPYPQGV